MSDARHEDEAKKCLCLPVSGLQAQAKRMAIRRTWMQMAKDRYPDVVIRFILAQVHPHTACTAVYTLAVASTP